jgi:uncharacterized hydrophobic protein (TIGR00341 family)
MAHRLIEMVIPADSKNIVVDLLKEHPVKNVWYDRLSDNQMLVRILLSAEETGAVLDALQKSLKHVDGFRIMLLPVEASIPRPEEEIPVVTKDKYVQEPEAQKKHHRLSREELHSDITEMTHLTTVYVVLVILSTIVAAVGIINDNVAVIIGAMVIAPLLGPNVAFSFATTLGDFTLAHQAFKTNLAGIIVVFACAAVIGFFFSVDPATPSIVSKTQVSLGDIGIALAAGTAGALALTTGISTALVGVMVAVALLPPLVTFGLLIGSGHLGLSVGALLLVLTNIICINLAGVVTFLLRGIRPLTWWEADKAAKATRNAIILWVVLLVLLVVVITVSQQR